MSGNRLAAEGELRGVSETKRGLPSWPALSRPSAQAGAIRRAAGAGVAATPGVDFDAARGAGFVRFSYCGPEADMRAATARLAEWRGRTPGPG